MVEVSSGGFGIGGRRAEGLDSASRASDAKEVCTNMTVDGAALGGFCSKNLIPAVALRHITKISTQANQCIKSNYRRQALYKTI